MTPVLRSIEVILLIRTSITCAGRESFVRGGVQLWQLHWRFFRWQIPLKAGHHRPASEIPFNWHCDFSREATNIAKKPYSFVIFQARGGGRTRCPNPLDPHISKCFGTNLIGEQQILRRAFTNKESHQNICCSYTLRKKKREKSHRKINL